MMKNWIAHLFLFAALLVASQARSATLLYAMTENGLLYRSADGAKTWQNIALPATPGQFEALAVDPENSSNLYVDVSVRGKAARASKITTSSGPPTGARHGHKASCPDPRNWSSWTRHPRTLFMRE